MKLLHTSDWHLGHQLYNYDRYEEQAAMLEQMVSIVEEEQPDVFLHCGDVFHTATPSAAVQQLFADTLVRLHERCPSMTIVVIAGNHDSPSRHEIFRTPWQSFGVHMIGQLDFAHLEDYIIEVPNKGFIITIPYTHERFLHNDTFVEMQNIVNELNIGGLPVVMAAHTTIRGCDFAGHEQATDRNVGGIDSIDIETLGTDYDYMALGHIHKPQFVHTGKHNVRYSGSPLPVSFSEDYEHSVSVVEIASHGEIPSVRTIAIQNPRPLVSLPVQGFAPWNEALRLLQNFPSDIGAYIRLNVEVDDVLPPGAFAEAYQMSEIRNSRFCYVNAHREESHTSQVQTFSVGDFKEKKPIDIARFYAENKNITFDESLQNLFDEVLKQVAINQRLK